MATQVQSYSPRITGVELPRNGNPIVIVSHKVQDKGNGNYQAVLYGENPFVKINWLRQSGTITPEMSNLLVPQDAVKPLNANKIYCWTDSDYNHSEGLRRLRWAFGLLEGPLLDSGVDPDEWYSTTGILLGSIAEGDGRLKIPGIDYFLQSEAVWGRTTLWDKRLYAQDKDMIHALSPAIMAAAKFTIPGKPDREWVRSEVERLEKNKEGLNERHVEDRFKQLKDHIWGRHSGIVAGEMLAWPINQEENYVNVKVPREQIDELRELAKRSGVFLTEI